MATVDWRVGREPVIHRTESVVYPLNPIAAHRIELQHKSSSAHLRMRLYPIEEIYMVCHNDYSSFSGLFLQVRVTPPVSRKND